MTRSTLVVSGALIGWLGSLACSFQDFDYLKEGRSDATGGAVPANGGFGPWHDDGRAGRRPSNWGGAPGFDGGVPAGGGSTGGSSGGTGLAGAAGA